MSFLSAFEIAAQVRDGDVTARAITEATLASIEKRDGALNAFTAVTADRALAAADGVDAARAAGRLHATPDRHLLGHQARQFTSGRLGDGISIAQLLFQDL